MSSTQCNITIPVGTAAEMLVRLTDTISYGIDGQVPSRTRPVADLIDAIASAPGMEPIDEHNRFFKGATRQWKSLADEAKLYPTSIAGIPPHRITSEILSHWDQLYAHEQTWRMLYISCPYVCRRDPRQPAHL